MIASIWSTYDRRPCTARIGNSKLISHAITKWAAYSDVSLTPLSNIGRWILNYATKITEKSWLLITNSKFSPLCYSATSMRPIWVAAAVCASTSEVPATALARTKVCKDKSSCLVSKGLKILNLPMFCYI